jgi:hypothetical protein
VKAIRAKNLIRTLSLTALMLGGLTTRSHAQGWFTPEWAFNGAPMASYLATSFRQQRIAFELGTRTGIGKARNQARVSTVTTGAASVARAMAASYPEAGRAMAQQTFEQLLTGYAAIEKQLGIPHGDVAGAMALFVVANLEAYRDTAFDPGLYQPVVTQIRDMLATSPDFARTSATGRRELFEQLAITGMFVAAVRAGLTSHPNPVTSRALQGAAKQYLAQVVKLDPARLQVTRSGLVLAKQAR